MGSTDAPADLAEPSAPARVLVLSDEPLQCEGVRALLCQHAYEAIPLEALERAERLYDRGRPCALVWLADRVTHEALDPVLTLRDAHHELGLVLVAIDQVLRGRSTLDCAFAGQLVRQASAAGPARLDRLSPTGRDVVCLLADGLRNSEIALRLARSEKSVEKHVSRVFGKLGLSPTRSPHLDRRVVAARLVFEERSGRTVES